MQADSSAKRTCRESRSTSLCTATVRIPISLQVQMILQAISPRLAMRIFRKRRGPFITVSCEQFGVRPSGGAALKAELRTIDCSLTLDSKEGLPVLDGLAILDVDLDNFASRFGLNLVHQLHGFNDADDGRRFDLAANPHKAVRGR